MNDNPPPKSTASNWLSGLHIGWLTHVAHGLGGIALFASNWDKIAGKITEQLPRDREDRD